MTLFDFDLYYINKNEISKVCGREKIVGDRKRWWQSIDQ